MHRRPRALDLFCCAGGASRGLQQAGFDVYGVDIAPQPNYPFWFRRADALNVSLDGFDLIWASPPCQRYTALTRLNKNAESHPDLIADVRNKLQKSNALWVIENVEGAPLKPTVKLCGTMFSGLRVLRHRLFEANFPIEQPEHSVTHPKVHTTDKRKLHFGKTDESKDFVQVTGGGNCTVAARRDAMRIPSFHRMTQRELNQAIPPAYAEYIGRAALAALAVVAG